MPERLPALSVLASAALAAALLSAVPAALAQKIVCWKDAAGKVIGCGDRVPPEFQKNESKRLDSGGITRQTTVSAEEAAKLKAAEDKKATLKLEEDRRIAEQRRQDTALVNTYTSAGEIDVRRDRELQVVDLQIQQLKAAVKGAVDAHTGQKTRYENFEKRGKVLAWFYAAIPVGSALGYTIGGLFSAHVPRPGHRRFRTPRSGLQRRRSCFDRARRRP